MKITEVKRKVMSHGVSEDREFAALWRIIEALTPLSAVERTRIVGYLAKRFGTGEPETW